MSEVIFLAAVANDGVLGFNGGIPWHYPEDIKRFKAITIGFPVIMGRKTWESLPIKPLPDRDNIVISNTYGNGYSRMVVYNNIEKVLYNYRESEKIFIIGGSQIFNKYFEYADTLDITHINKDYPGDVYFPTIDTNDWNIVSVRDSGDLTFKIYRRKSFYTSVA